jgi:hypothetical protein
MLDRSKSIPCDNCVRQPYAGVSSGSGQALLKVLQKRQQIDTKMPACGSEGRRLKVAAED